MPESEAASALRARVLAAAAGAPSATRSRGRAAAAAFLAASIAIGVSVFEGIGGFAHGAGRPLPITCALAGGWMAVSASLAWLVVGRGGATLARSPVMVGAAAVLTPFVLFAWMRLFNGVYIEPYSAVGYRCLGYTLLISALPLAAFLGLRRAVEPRHPAILGAGAGAASAAWAGALIDLWCPLTNTMHVLVGHVAPLLGAMLVGALVGQFTLGVRPYRPRS
jgi:negative regulator of sigma F NrsF-like protein